ncbi:hypothetical protein [Cupriavidus pauculus]|uniref:Uncharacterized protein n=1 Tax=Cupriavidus pauculus TaxID=82633 RepID=A0A2N5C5L8_9BURK|nr:hypothetical protein [Cupriavidus pauculus]PLP97516.1 hypothetical protein CYJ10_27205 [Cupriavidus pauculus]
MSTEGTPRQSVLLALKDPRTLEGAWNGMLQIWNDLHNPYSLRYDQLIADGHAALASGCLAAMALELQIDEVGACGERARIRIDGHMYGAAPRASCVHEVIHEILLPELAKNFDFEVVG